MTNRYFIAPQPGDHVWVFAKGPMGPARWLAPVRVWEIDGAGRALPVTVVELKNPYASPAVVAAGYDYATPMGDYYLYDNRIFDSVGDAFNQWCMERAEKAT